MRKNIIRVVLFVAIFQSIFGNFMYVEAIDGANKQPAVCNGPSETMSNYFSFQSEMKSALLGSDVEERRFNAAGGGWLFTKGTLKLPGAIDLIASSVRSNTKSTVSTVGTSVVLLLMAAVSVLQSNTEGLAILFKDRPIVRDYKTMLDIETDLFDLAYFRSKQMNLTVKLNNDSTYDNLNKIIEKYKGLGLLEGEGQLQKTESLSNILVELISMNTAMKNFILFWGAPGDKALNDYNGCFGNSYDDKCALNPIIKFTPQAINNLTGDYAGIGTFGACNLTFSNFKNSITKSINNNSDSIKVAFDDVKNAMNTLKSALLGNKSNGKTKVNKNNRCDNMSDYEMAQIRAYWGPNWTCGKWVDVSYQISKAREFVSNKSAQNKQRKGSSSILKESAKTNMTSTSVEAYEKLKGGDLNLVKIRNASDKEKINLWHGWYCVGVDSCPEEWQYNTEFIYELADDVMYDYVGLMGEYDQSQGDAISSDYSVEYTKIRGLLDQVNMTIESSKILENRLKKVAKKQCAS